MKNKICTFILIVFILFTICSNVYAEDLPVDSVNPILTTSAPSEENNTEISPENDNNAYTIDSNVSGNVFKATSDFILLDTASVNGNLYIVADNVTLKSNVTYSDEIAKDGENSIDKINSYSQVSGNVFVVCKDFTMESGVEIKGDLYIVAQDINIQKSSYIYGNIFATCSNLSLNGKVGNSVYVASENFNMSYYGSIANDLYVSTQDATLSSVIHRNAEITSNKLSTTQDFLLYGNLNAEALDCEFSGEVDGNAIIKSKELNFIDTDSKCLIKGNLDYSCAKELDISNKIVSGEINYSNYVEKNNNTKSSSLAKNFILNLITFIVYVLVIVLIFNFIFKSYANTKRDITLKNIFACLGIGLLSILAVITITILLIIMRITITLSLILIFAYILALFLAIPLFILDIANLLKEKINVILGAFLISLALYIITTIPVIGGIIMSLFTLIGLGRIIKNLLFTHNVK